MTFWWPFPLVLSCWFDSRIFSSRRWQLFAYAIATGFVDATTSCGVVPRFIDPVETILLTALVYGPAHLIVAFLIESIVQAVLDRWRVLTPLTDTGALAQPFTFSLLAGMYCFTVVCIALGFPFAGRTFAIQAEKSFARSRAESDWKSGKPAIYREREELGPNGTFVEYEIDRETGFRIRRPRPDFGFENAYNERIRELMQTDHLGASQKKKLPTPEELLALLDSPNLQEVTSLPYEVTSSIVVFRNGSISRWGGSASSTGDGLSITTEAGGLIGVGDSVKPVFVQVPSDDNGLVVIRNGNSWVGVFQKNGECVASISRYP